MEQDYETVIHPTHYNKHPAGIEIIHIIKHHNLCVGTALKHLLRAGLKPIAGKSMRESQVEDLRKAINYIQFEIDRLKEV